MICFQPSAKTPITADDIPRPPPCGKGTLSGAFSPRSKSLISKGLETPERVCDNQGMKIGYARVSTDEQDLTLQLDALQAEGCDQVFQDTASGARAVNRKGLADALDACAPGDVLTAWKIDRLGRSLADLVGLVETLKARDIGLKVLTGVGASIDTTKADGRMIFGLFAVLAEFERELIRERTKAGMQAAKRRGRHVGRPRKLSADQIAMARELMAADRSQREVARALGVAVSTLREAITQRPQQGEIRRGG